MSSGSILLLLFSLASSYVYAVQPIVTGISPINGTSAGATAVTITGSGFTGATAVKFGTTAAESFVVNSDTSITATTAAHVPQVVSVNVTSPDGTSINSENSFYVYQGNWMGYLSTFSNLGVGLVNTLTDNLLSLITVGSGPFAIGIKPDGAKVYVANYNDGTISVIDATNNTVTSTITIGDGSSPLGVAITPNGAKLYVVNYMDGVANGTVSVIDTTSDAVIDTITVGVGPYCLVITPNGSEVYVLNYIDGTVDGTISVIDTTSDTVTATITVGVAPYCLVITPDGSEVYVVNDLNGSVNGTVSVIDTSTHLVTHTVTVGILPYTIAITPDGTKAYVGNNQSSSISMIDIATHTVTDTFVAGDFPFCMIINHDGTKGYVANNGLEIAPTVTIFDTITNLITDTVSVSHFPNYLAIRPDGGQIYSLSSDINFMSAIDTLTLDVTSINVSQNQSILVIMPDQAPLAKFTAEVEPNSTAVTFDASTSLSPTGTISQYSWNFGDGNTLDTSNPLAQHIYAGGGTYTVTLTVTNSAGTSNSQLFNFNTSSNGEGASYISPMTNNGGNSATAIQIITFGLSPPTNGSGQKITNRSPFEIEWYNQLNWDPSISPSAIGYNIRRNGKLIANAYPGTQYKDHNRPQKKTDVYTITSVNATGIESTPITIRVPK